MATFNVRDYGAKGDSVTDDTDAIQRTICAALGSTLENDIDDALKQVRYAKGSIEIPAGIYKITRPIRIWAAMHLNFLGEGGSTRFYPVGTMESVLDINGACNCEIGRFLIQGHNDESESIENAIYYYWDGKTKRTSASCHFHDINVLGTRCVTGFRIGKLSTTGQCDTTSYNNIVLQGDYNNKNENNNNSKSNKWHKYGFYVGTDVFANCLEHWFRDVNITHWQEGTHVSVTNYSLTNGNFGGNGVDIVANTLSYFTIQGIRSELSKRLLVVGTGPSQSSANFTVSDVLFWTDSLADDGEVIQFLVNGTLYLRNVVISPEKQPKIFVNPLRYCSLIIDGFTCSSRLHDLLRVNDRVDSSVRGFVTEYTDGGFLSSDRKL